jgi:hypothetical protein
MTSPSDFAAFILTHGRPDNVRTWGSLQRHGYTGPVYLVVDNEDPCLDAYQARFPDVIVFDKAHAAQQTPLADNFPGRSGAIVFARNACFQIARTLGLEYFIQLDDDYFYFGHRFTRDGAFREFKIKNLDAVFAAMLRFYQATPFLTFAMAQGGDMFAGKATRIRMKRKAMNSLICSVDRPFTFLGRINEDVSTYIALGSQGHLFGQVNAISLHQAQTQSQEGGMTDLYRKHGTYTKSFYAVMHAPSCVRVQMMRTANPRLHHQVRWNNAVPKIVSESLRKPR